MASAADTCCAVCLAEARDPRRVPCGNGHVFCLRCLQGLVTHGNNVHDNSFPCPCCRKLVDIPPGGVACFPGWDGARGECSQPAPHGPADRRARRPVSRRRQWPPAVPGDDLGFGFRGHGFWPGPPRHHPGFSRAREPPRGDLQTDSQEYGSARHDNPHHPFQPPPFDPFRSFAFEQRGRGRQMFPRGRRSAGGGGGGRREAHVAGPVYHDDLDMDEVMLVIAQMEAQEHMA
ncbi:hypothetical protein ACOMHN_027492 [Nucella lapillus]